MVNMCSCGSVPPHASSSVPPHPLATKYRGTQTNDTDIQGHKNIAPLQTSHLTTQASLLQLYHKKESHYKGTVSYVYIVLTLTFYITKPLLQSSLFKKIPT